MDIHYFSTDLTPHLSPLIKNLGLNEGLPFTIDDGNKCDVILNNFFLSLASPQSRSVNTWRTYAEQLSFFFRFLASDGKTWRDATHHDLLRYYRIRRINESDLKISARSWNVFVAALKRFYEWAVKNSHLLVVPFDYRNVQSGSPHAIFGELVISIDMKERGVEKDIKYLTEEDFREKLLPAVSQTRQGIRNALFVRLLMRSGLRADEAVKVRLSMLPDPDHSRYAGRKTCPMTVLGKGQKERTVRVPKSWLRDAQRYIEWDRADATDRWDKLHPCADANKMGHKDYLFVTEAGTPISYAAMYAMMRKAGEKARFNFKAHPHMLRHSYAIYQLSAMIKALLELRSTKYSSTGEAYRRMIQDPLRKLQRLLGHSSITTTFVYLDYVDDIDEIVDVTLDEEGFNVEDGYEDVSNIDV